MNQKSLIVRLGIPRFIGGRMSNRILFTILDGQDVSTVRILHIRHASQQTLGEEPEEPDTT